MQYCFLRGWMADGGPHELRIRARKIFWIILLAVGIALVVLSLPNLNHTSAPGTPSSDEVIWTVVFLVSIFDIIPVSVILLLWPSPQAT